MSIRIDSLRENYKLSYGVGLNLQTAKKMLVVGEGEAKKLNIKVSMAIVDAGGNLLAFSRMDNAPLNGIQVAIDKAFTAIFGKVPSGNWGIILGNLSVKERFTPLFLHQRWMTMPGGFPIIKNRQIIGGVGVGGGTGTGDIGVAKAMLKTGKFCLKDVDAATKGSTDMKRSGPTLDI
jgi:uncharacterized protein GlcG (DUF336 family)